MLFLAFDFYNQQRGIQLNGIETVGKIIDKNYRKNVSRRLGTYLTVSFVDEQGKSRVFETFRNSAFDKYNMGDNVTVIYEKDNPNNATVNEVSYILGYKGYTGYIEYIFILTLLGMVFLVFSISRQK